MKKVLFALLFYLLGLTCFSQSCDELNLQVVQLYEKGSMEEALIVAVQAEKKCRSELNFNPGGHYLSISNLAELYIKKGNFAMAEPFYLQIVTIKKNTFGNQHSEYANALNKLASLYQDMGNYLKAEPFFLEALEINKKTFGEDHPNYGKLLNNLALLYTYEGNFTKAESMYLKALSINKKAFGSNHSEFATTLNNLALFYKAIGNYAKAVSLLLEVQLIRKETLPANHPDYAVLLNNLASLYGDMGDYTKAEPLLLEAVNINRKSFGEQHPTYATSINNLALLYNNLGSYVKAEPLYKEALAIRKKILGEQHPIYATSVNNLAAYYTEKGNYAEAELLFLEALSIEKKTLGEQHPQYLGTLHNLASLYKDMGKYEKAESLFLEALTIRKKTLGVQHPDVANSSNSLAALYKNMGNYTRAETLFLEVLTIRKETLPANHPDYLITKNNIASLYDQMGNYVKAESLYLEVLSIRKKTFGEQHPDYAMSLNNLAYFYKEMGDYAKSEPLYLEALTILKKIFGEQHPGYLTTLNNVSLLYYSKGNYFKAESLILEVLSIRKKTLGEQHPDYAASLNNLAIFYENMGNDAKAEPLYIEALNIRKKTLGELHPEYAASINNLGKMYMNIGDYTKVEPMYQEALAIIKRTMGEQHPAYAESLLYLAGLYKQLGNYIKAEPMYVEALDIQKKTIGEYHPNYAISLNNLAGLYHSIGRFTEAELFYLRALSICKKVLGEQHPHYTTPLNNLAILYENYGLINKADSVLRISSLVLNNNWKSNFSFLTNVEAELFLTKKTYEFEFLESRLIKINNTDLLQSIFNLNLLLKNVLFSNFNLFDRYASTSNDTSINKIWSKYKLLKNQIVKAYQLPLTQQKNIDAIIEESNILEKILIQKLPEFQNRILNKNISWQDVQSKLKLNEAAIDFVSFRYYNKYWTDTTIYAAFVLRPGWEKPKFVSLFNEDELIKILGNKNNAASINYIYGQAGETSPTNGLYQLLMQPIEHLLRGVKKIYLSPSGLLHRISFSAIALPEGGKMIDKYEVQTMSNIRMLAEKHVVDTSIHSVSLFGGIDYENEPSVILGSSSFAYTSSDTSTSLIELRNIRGGKWAALPGTTNEIGDIQNIATSLKIPVVTYSMQNASEESFKLLGDGKKPAPSIMHIATHGFAYSIEKEKPPEAWMLNTEKIKPLFKQSSDPLTRAGLVMGGGNQVWTKGKSYLNREDGILTAREVSDLDLRGCVLATLSACETGLGDIKGSEGVFGLQRAFKMAGVQNLIVSLWQVPDKETAEFMVTFYTSWLKQKLPIKEAFRQTQLTLSKKYKPYQWAAFVLAE